MTDRKPAMNPLRTASSTAGRSASDTPAGRCRPRTRRLGVRELARRGGDAGRLHARIEAAREHPAEQDAEHRDRTKPAVREMALLMAEATPLSAGSDESNTVVVSGAMKNAAPIPSRTTAGK